MISAFCLDLALLAAAESTESAKILSRRVQVQDCTTIAFSWATCSSNNCPGVSCEPTNNENGSIHGRFLLPCSLSLLSSGDRFEASG